MDSEMDDPFTTPNRNASFDPSMILSLSSSSPNQLKRTLEAHLQEVNKRIENAGALGRKLLTQQQDIEANIKELEEGGDTVDPELKKKLVDLEKEYIEVGREASRAALTSKVMTGGISPLRAGNVGVPSSNEALVLRQSLRALKLTNVLYSFPAAVPLPFRLKAQTLQPSSRFPRVDSETSRPANMTSNLLPSSVKGSSLKFVDSRRCCLSGKRPSRLSRLKRHD